MSGVAQEMLELAEKLKRCRVFGGTKAIPVRQLSLSITEYERELLEIALRESALSRNGGEEDLSNLIAEPKQKDSAGRGKYSKVIRGLHDGIAALASQMDKIVAEKDAEIAMLKARLEYMESKYGKIDWDGAGEALQKIIEIDQHERKTLISADPAGNDYAVELVDGPCAKLARAALAMSESEAAHYEAIDTLSSMPPQQPIANVRDFVAGYQFQFDDGSFYVPKDDFEIKLLQDAIERYAAIIKRGTPT